MSDLNGVREVSNLFEGMAKYLDKIKSIEEENEEIKGNLEALERVHDSLNEENEELNKRLSWTHTKYCDKMFYDANEDCTCMKSEGEK